MGLELKTINLGIEEADSPPSQSYFESFWDSLLSELKTIYLKIGKADSPPPQLYFERVRDFLLSVVESTNFEIGDRDSVFEGLDNSLLSALETISEVDSPRSQFIFERLQLFRRLLYFTAKFIGKRIYGSQLRVLDRLYLYFWHSFGRITYSLYEIKLPNPIHYPPTKATQDAEIRNPSSLRPILELETSKYPDGMCCVQLGLGLYFFGGKFNIDKLEEDEKAKFMNGTRNVLPRDVYFFSFTLYNYCPQSLLRLNKDMLFQLAPMKYGKANPQAFVVSSQIFVIGSNINIDGLDDEDFAYFEVYDTFSDSWTVLPNPPIRGITWVGNAVVESGKAFLVGIWDEQRHVFCYNIHTREWTYNCDLRYLPILSAKIEYVENGFYGCYRNTVLHLAVASNELSTKPWKDVKPWDLGRWDSEQWELFELWRMREEEGGEEEDQFQQVASRLRIHYHLRMVSKEKGMDAIYNVPPQLQSSSTLLHLGSGYFCYVRTGKRRPQIHDDEVDDDDIPSNRIRFTSIVIFQTAPRETYEKNILQFFRAQFVYSKHYTFYPRFGGDLFIKGCYAHGPSEPLG